MKKEGGAKFTFVLANQTLGGSPVLFVVGKVRRAGRVPGVDGAAGAAGGVARETD